MCEETLSCRIISIQSCDGFIVEDLRGETMVSPSKKLEDLIRLAELCVDLLQQNEEHYAEVSVESVINQSIHDINESKNNILYVYPIYVIQQENVNFMCF